MKTIQRIKTELINPINLKGLKVVVDRSLNSVLIEHLPVYDVLLFNLCKGINYPYDVLKQRIMLQLDLLEQANYELLIKLKFK